MGGGGGESKSTTTYAPAAAYMPQATLQSVQNYANIGDRVVACTDEGTTIKEFHRHGNSVLLMPRSDNPNN